MNIIQIYTAAPGSRFLVTCEPKAQEEMLDSVCSSMPSDFKSKTHLNTSSMTAMDISPDENPNHFSDLTGLCAKLIAAAGKRSHFEGLLLLNISALTGSSDTIRLKALGELLSMPGGLTSKCVTLLYGPEKESDLLACADPLDFDGRLKVICFKAIDKLTLSELLAKSAMRCISSETEKMLASALDDMSAYEDFNARKFIQSCGNDSGLITKHTLSAALSEPYSYINRIKKASTIQPEKLPTRSIGFQSSR